MQPENTRVENNVAELASLFIKGVSGDKRRSRFMMEGGGARLGHDAAVSMARVFRYNVESGRKERRTKKEGIKKRK